MPHLRGTTGRGLLAVVALLLALGASAAACSSDPASGDASGADALTVTDARAAVDSDPSGAAIYLTVRNDGDADDQLTGASTAEGSGMLHESSDDGGRATMRMLSEMEVPAGGELVLEPGGAHLMVAVPDGRVGDRFDLTLTFAEAGDVVVPVELVSADEVLG
jgi:copper(I)-binding protein